MNASIDSLVPPPRSLTGTSERDMWRRLMAAIFSTSRSLRTLDVPYDTAYRWIAAIHRARHGPALYEALQVISRHVLTTEVRPFVEQAAAFRGLNGGPGLGGSGTDSRDLLEVMCAKWARHRMSTAMLHNLFLLLDKKMRQEAASNVGSVHVDVSSKLLNLFREVLMVERPAIAARLTERILEVLSRERHLTRQRPSPDPVVQTICGMLSSFGPEFYGNLFEMPFLEASREFYRQESVRLLKEPVSVYAAATEFRLQEEEDRGRMYYGTVTGTKVRELLTNLLILDHLTNQLANVKSSSKSAQMTPIVAALHSKDFTALKALYNVVLRAQTRGFESLMRHVSAYIRERGKEIVSPEAITGMGHVVPRVDAIMEGLFELITFADELHEKSFARNPIYGPLVSHDLDHIANLNPEMPMLLATYLHIYMLTGGRKGPLVRHQFQNGAGSGTSYQTAGNVSKSANQTSDQRLADNQLELCVRVLKHVHEKEKYEVFHRRHLASRLLRLDRSIRDKMNGAAEETMQDGLVSEGAIVARIRETCNTMFSSKMEVMSRDWNLSGLHGEDFIKISSASDANQKMDIEVLMLTDSVWPLPAANESSLRMNQQFMDSAPQSMVNLFAQYKMGYVSKRSGRLVSLLPQYGRVEMELTIDPVMNGSADGPPLRTHLIRLSTFQAILLHSIAKLRPRLMDLVAQFSAMPRSQLFALLKSLTRPDCPIVAHISQDTQNEDIFGDMDLFTVNPTFGHERYFIELPHLVTMMDAEPERKLARGRADEEIKYKTEAALVRILKAAYRNADNGCAEGKNVSHVDLVTAATRALAAQFVPEADIVKRSLESLIERDLIARSPDRTDEYFYVP